jgi:hypothetical protein
MELRTLRGRAFPGMSGRALRIRVGCSEAALCQCPHLGDRVASCITRLRPDVERDPTQGPEAVRSARLD